MSIGFFYKLEWNKKNKLLDGLKKWVYNMYIELIIVIIFVKGG